MSRSAKGPVRNSLLFVGAAAFAAAAWFGLSQILRADAFSKFGSAAPSGAEVGVTMGGVEFKGYEKGRLAATAKADKIEVRRDRSIFEMSGVRDGTFIDKDGKKLAFNMKDAKFEYFRNKLTAESGAHVKGDDFDLTSDQIVYEQAKSRLAVNGKVRGFLADGKVQAVGVTLDTATQAIHGLQLEWTGEIEGVIQEGQRKEWSLGGEDFERSKDGKTQIYTKGHATDGEVFVLADRVEYTRETDVLVAKGNVKYYGVDSNMLCDEATVYRKDRRAVFTGTVHMVIKAKDDDKVVQAEFPTIERVTPESLKTNPQGATQQQVEVLRDADNVRKYPIKVVADKVEYWYKKGERHAVITGSPFARQDLTEGWRSAWANEVYYDGEAETLTLKSRPDQKDALIVMSIGDYHKAQWLTLSTKEDDNYMKGHDIASGMFFEEDEVPTRTNTGGTGGTTTTGGTTGG